jgi:hypothetical protein
VTTQLANRLLILNEALQEGDVFELNGQSAVW